MSQSYSEAQSPSPSVASCIQHGGVHAMGALPRFPSPRWAHPPLENHDCCRLTATLIAGELAATDWKLPRLGGSIPRALEQPEWPSSTESQTPCLKVRPARRCDGGPVLPMGSAHRPAETNTSELPEPFVFLDATLLWNVVV